MEFTLPLFAKREITKLSEETFFDEEKLEKINLSKGQAKRILNKVERSSNWVHGELDELVNERLSFYTREEIYNKIPHIENMYWIFTNRSNGLKDRHSIEETINERCYYSISFAAFDVESRVLYYYTFSR
ncbi:MAG: hypothetical protein IJ809_00585 [Clostridia bacterium]|nr:hypothetical protein [Clostridia bacterium]